MSPSDAKSVISSISSSSSSISSTSSTLDPNAADITQAFKSVSIEDLRSVPETVATEIEQSAGDENDQEMDVSDHNESDDLASDSSSSSGSASSSSSDEEKSGLSSGDASMDSDESEEDYHSTEEKAPSDGSVLNSQKSTSESSLAEENQPPPDGFGGFSLAQLTSTGELESPQVIESFKTSMYWCLKQLGTVLN